MNARNSRFMVVGLLLLVLGSGVAIGIVLDRLWLGNGAAVAPPASDQQRVEQLLARFKNDLKLDPAQEKSARSILLRGRRDVSALLARIEPEVRASRQKTREEIAKLLTSEQARRYEELVARYRAKRAAQEAKSGAAEGSQALCAGVVQVLLSLARAAPWLAAALSPCLLSPPSLRKNDDAQDRAARLRGARSHLHQARPDGGVVGGALPAPILR